MAREMEHNNDLLHTNCPKWDPANPKRTLINICNYFESPHGSSGTLHSYILWKDIFPLKHTDKINGNCFDTNAMMIKQCPIIPIEQHATYYNRVDADMLKGLTDQLSPEFLLDLAMCYAKLKFIVYHTPAKTCINKFHKTHNVHTVFRHLQFTFHGPGFTQRHAGQLKDKLLSLKYK